MERHQFCHSPLVKAVTEQPAVKEEGNILPSKERRMETDPFPRKGFVGISDLPYVGCINVDHGVEQQRAYGGERHF